MLTPARAESEPQGPVTVNTPASCSSNGGGFGVVLAIALMVVAVAGPVFSAAWLGVRARRG